VGLFRRREPLHERLPREAEGRIVTVLSGSETADELFRNAGLALQVAKKAGKGRYQRYEPSMRTGAIAADVA